MKWWWLSFGDDAGVLGVAIAQARTDHEAVLACRWVDGEWEHEPRTDRAEVAVLPVPAELGDPPSGYTGRLLTTDEADAMWARWCPQDPRCGLLSEIQAEIGEERLS